MCLCLSTGDRQINSHLCLYNNKESGHFLELLRLTAIVSSGGDADGSPDTISSVVAFTFPLLLKLLFDES